MMDNPSRRGIAADVGGHYLFDHTVWGVTTKPCLPASFGGIAVAKHGPLWSDSIATCRFR
jgi:hypothetical protein